MSCWCGAAGSILALAAALASPGCDNNKARPVPPGPAGLPPAAGNPAAAPDKAALTHAPTGGATGELPAGHPAVGGAPTAMPADHPPTLQAAPPPAAESGRLEGALKLSDKVKGKVPAGATIFLVARAFSEPGPGMILAVKKLDAATWPVPYALSGGDMMIPGTKLEGKVVISARVDQDGDAMTKAVGDLEGVTKPIDVPAKGAAKVDVVFDTIRTQAAGTPLNLGGGGPMGGGPMGAPMGAPMGTPMGGGAAKPPGHP